MTKLALTVLLVSVAGSFHCTTMCGGLIAFATSGTSASLRTRLGAVASYNGMRGLGYVALGSTAGGLGSALDGAFVRIGIGRVAGAVAGVVMLAWGLVKLVEAVSRFRVVRAPSRIHVPVANLIKRLREQSPAARSAVVGGCTAALPCGFLHAALVVAAGTGSVAGGAVVAAAFWLGTLPSVVGLALGVDLLTHGIRRHASIVGAAALVMLGFSSLLGRWSPAAFLKMGLPHGIHAEQASHVR